MKNNNNLAIEAIISLENAYTNKDLNAVIESKDFFAEAKLILKSASYNYDLNDNEVVSQTANLLKFSLIQSLNENGYPSFENAIREFSELKKIDDNIYFIKEKLFFPNEVNYINNIYLSHVNNVWKVALVEE